MEFKASNFETLQQKFKLHCYICLSERNGLEIRQASYLQFSTQAVCIVRSVNCTPLQASMYLSTQRVLIHQMLEEFLWWQLGRNINRPSCAEYNSSANVLRWSRLELWIWLFQFCQGNLNWTAIKHQSQCQLSRIICLNTWIWIQ